MKMSVICRSMRVNHGYSGPASSAGFTILELLVVLALMAAMTGLALPQFVRMYEAGQRAFERRQVLDDIAALPYRAFEEQQGFVLRELPGQSEAVPLVMPDGWTLKARGEQGIQYRPNGVCAGGSVLVSHGDEAEEFLLAPPLCRPEL